MQKSKTLKEFYNAYWDWLQEGAPVPHPIFSRSVGLCGNAENFGVEDSYMQIETATGGVVPFNASSGNKFTGRDYGYERSSSTMHLNPARIRWVKDHK